MRSPAEQPQSATDSEGNTGGDVLKKRILQGLTGSLPPMPQIVLKAQEIMSNPKSSLKELASVIATDQAISIRVLKLANSSYYGLSGKVTSIGHASGLLGIKRLGEVIIMAGAFNLLDKKMRGYNLDAGELWRHALMVGVGSRIIANVKVPEMENEGFSAGLIHDAGKIMMDQHVNERKGDFEEALKGGKKSLIEAEKEILGIDHAEVGAEVCKAWGIPGALTEAIKSHHNPSASKDNKLAHILHIADALDFVTESEKDSEIIPYKMEEKSLAFLGLEETQLGKIKDRVVKIVNQITGQILEE